MNKQVNLDVMLCGLQAENCNYKRDAVTRNKSAAHIATLRARDRR
jgi:hypothetical protein